MPGSINDKAVRCPDSDQLLKIPRRPQAEAATNGAAAASLTNGRTLDSSLAVRSLKRAAPEDVEEPVSKKAKTSGPEPNAPAVIVLDDESGAYVIDD